MVYYSERQFSSLRRRWGFKKNTQASYRQELLKAIESKGISEEGNIGTVSLTTEKVNRWRRELDEENQEKVLRIAQKNKGKILLPFSLGQLVWARSACLLLTTLE